MNIGLGPTSRCREKGLDQIAQLVAPREKTGHIPQNRQSRERCLNHNQGQNFRHISIKKLSPIPFIDHCFENTAM